MDICKGCGKEFNAWSSKERGKPQKYPYQRCYSCKQNLEEKQEGQAPSTDSPTRNSTLIIVDELQEIKEVIKDIRSALQEKGINGQKQKIGKDFVGGQEDEELPPDYPF